MRGWVSQISRVGQIVSAKSARSGRLGRSRRSSRLGQVGSVGTVGRVGRMGSNRSGRVGSVGPHWIEFRPWAKFYLGELFPLAKMVSHVYSFSPLKLLISVNFTEETISTSGISFP